MPICVWSFAPNHWLQRFASAECLFQQRLASIAAEKWNCEFKNSSPVCVSFSRLYVCGITSLSPTDSYSPFVVTILHFGYVSGINGGRIESVGSSSFCLRKFCSRNICVIPKHYIGTGQPGASDTFQRNIWIHVAYNSHVLKLLKVGTDHECRPTPFPNPRYLAAYTALVYRRFSGVPSFSASCKH